jgi:hypothetical protein
MMTTCPAPLPRAGGSCLVLLLLVALAGCNSGSGLSEIEKIQKKKDDAKAAIEHAGGQVTVFHHSLGDGWTVNLSGAQISDDLFDHLKALERVAELDLSRSSVTDDQLGKLNEQGVGNLITKLDLSNTAVTDAGLEKLTGLGMLSQLKVVGAKVTAAGVQRFKDEHGRNPNSAFKTPAVQGP